MGIFNFLKKKELEVDNNIDDNSDDIVEQELSVQLEKPSIDSMKITEKEEYLSESSKQIKEAQKQIDEAKIEYQAVTAYLTDMQKIDQIPIDDKGEITDAARNIVTLTREREKFQGKKNIKIAPNQYKLMQQYERDIPKELLKLKKNEEYQMVIKNDIRTLEGEKGVLTFQKEEIIHQQKYLKALSIITSGIVLGLFVLLYIVSEVTNKEMTIPYVLTIIMAMISAGYIFYESRKNMYDGKMTDKKMNRAISLLNTVKIKYVNNSNLIDYECSKFNVNSSSEFKYLWEQYVKLREEEQLYKNNTDLLNHHNNQLIALLREFQISDPEVWIYQALALIDNKEMVEVRHRLNVRRNKIRERINYNSDFKKEKQTEMLKILEKNPELKRVLVNMSFEQ